MPSDSTTDAIVDAVPMTMQWPAERDIEASASMNCSRLMTPAFTGTLYFRMGSSYAGSQGVANYPGGQLIPIAPLEHFRLIQETSEPKAFRRLRIYERVAGARLQVTGAPGTRVLVAYAFRAPGGREYTYRYLVNGEEWHNDWAADRYVPNEFGTDNSVVNLVENGDAKPKRAAKKKL